MRTSTRPFTVALTLGLALVIGLALPAAAAPGDTVWQSTFNGPGLSDTGFYSTTSRDGATVFVTGNGSPNLSDPDDIVTIAYNAATGTQRWAKRIDGPATDGADRPSGIVASPTADLVFVAGRVTAATGDGNWRVTAYAGSTGAVVWQRGFTGTDGPDDDSPYAIAVGPGGGRVYVTGSEGFVSGGQAIRTIAYDTATGATVWSRRVGDASTGGFANAISVSPDGSRVVVAGGSGGPQQRAAVASYRATDGQLQWTRLIARAPDLPIGDNSYDRFDAVGVSPDGSRVFAVGGTTTGGSTSAILVVSLAAPAGTPQWTVRRAANATGFAQASALSVGPGGKRIFVSGTDQTATGGRDWIVLSYRVTDGTTTWVRRFGGTANLNDNPLASVLKPDGSRLFVTGSVRNTGTGRDGRTVALNPVDGTTVWNRTVDGTAHLDDWLAGISIGPAGGRVYVTGSTQTGVFLAPTAGLTVAYTS